MFSEVLLSNPSGGTKLPMANATWAQSSSALHQCNRDKLRSSPLLHKVSMHAFLLELQMVVLVWVSVQSACSTCPRTSVHMNDYSLAFALLVFSYAFVEPESSLPESQVTQAEDHLMTDLTAATCRAPSEQLKPLRKSNIQSRINCDCLATCENEHLAA